MSSPTSAQKVVFFHIWRPKLGPLETMIAMRRDIPKLIVFVNT